MSTIVTSDGEELDEKDVRDDYNKQFKKSVAYQCLTKGHVWPDEPNPGDTVLICRRCNAEFDLGEEEEEEQV